MLKIIQTQLRDRALLSGLIAKITQASASPISALLILIHFAPELQGYYYTFSSLLALQVFVELGLSTAITVFAGHEWAGLSLDSQGRVVGRPESRSRLAALVKKALRWYLISACVLVIVLVFAGVFLLGRAPSDSEINWMSPWLVLCALSAGTLALTPGWAILMGCDQVARVNVYRAAETIGRSIILWIAIIGGAQLWSLSIAAAFSLVFALFFLGCTYRNFFLGLLREKDSGALDWKNEVLPLQVRYAISWISGYFAFSVFTPVTFHFLGPVAAGKMGMSWAIVSGLSGLAATWIQVRSPSFGALVAQRSFVALDRLAWQTARIAFSVAALSTIGAILALLALASIRPDLAARLLPLPLLAVFMLAEIFHQVSMVQSSYLRAFKKEPFLVISAVTGLTIGVGTVVFTGWIGEAGPAISYFVGVSISCVWGSWIFWQCWRKWTFPRENTGSS